MVIDLEPDTVFIVECETPLLGTAWVECDSAESAYLARWTLPRDSGTMGSKVKITNVNDGKVVFNA